MLIAIKVAVVVLGLIVFSMLLKCCLSERAILPVLRNKAKMAFAGTFANGCDTLGLGSYAIIVALSKAFRLIDDQLLPGTLNGQAILPTMVESLFFLEVVHVSLLMLVTLLAGACLGAFISGYVVSRLNRQMVRLSMGMAFLLMAVLVLLNQLHLLPIAGDKTMLATGPLILAFFLMIIAGALPAVGIGIYAPIQIILFLLGVSPLLAFPIMSTACALQVSVTTIPFVYNRHLDLKAAAILGLFGCLGVMIAAPFVAHLKLANLRWLLLIIILYNTVMLFRSYFLAKRQP